MNSGIEGTPGRPQSRRIRSPPHQAAGWLGAWLAAGLVRTASGDAPVAPTGSLEIRPAGNTWQVSVKLGGQEVLRAPPEGLWSVAFD